MTTDWRHYIWASYKIVYHADANIKPKLDETLESYLVNLLARNFKEPEFSEKPVAISLMESMSKPGYQKKQAMAVIGDECLFIHGFEYNKRKWPTETYFQDMGIMAYGHASVALRPPDILYSHLEQNFNLMGKVIRQINKMV